MEKEKKKYELQLKSLKPIVLREASDWIRDKAKNITDQLTKQHRLICKNFVEYMNRNERYYRERE